jgi:hypothetical protein
MNYPDELRRELTSVGITGSLRARILAEIEDHLECNPSAELGAPGALAAQFADELGTNRARRAAGRTFAALALAGLLFGVAFVGGPAAAFGAAPAGAPVLGRLARIAAVLASQVAFVAGVLAALRAVRGRRAAVIPAAEVSIILRRASIGAVAGVVTMASLGVIALVFHGVGSSSWYWYARIASILGIVALVATVPSLLAARRLRPVAPGGPGDIFDDLGGWVPAPLGGHPWRLAVMVATGIAVALALAGLPGDDFYDGIARGVLDAMACLIGFATLGRYLGLWSPASR